MTGAPAQIQDRARVQAAALPQSHEQRLDHQEGRVREAVQETIRLGVEAQDREGVAVGRSRMLHERPERHPPRVVEAEQRQQRLFTLIGLQLMHRLTGCVVGDQHRNTGHHGKRTAVAAEHARFDPLLCALERLIVHERQATPAKGAAQHGKQRLAHV